MQLKSSDAKCQKRRFICFFIINDHWLDKKREQIDSDEGGFLFQKNFYLNYIIILSSVNKTPLFFILVVLWCTAYFLTVFIKYN